MLFSLFGLTRVFGQGTVDFRNDTAVLTSPPDRLIRFFLGSDPYNPYGWDNAPAVGTNFMVQLYYGASTASQNTLVAVTNSPATLRGSTSSQAGTWRLGGLRTLSGFGFGSLVQLQVRLWDINFGATYEQALQSGVGLVAGSQPFLYTIPQSPSSSSQEFLMSNFQGFKIGNFDLPPGPYVYNGPEDLTVAVGQAASFSVSVSSSTPFSYSWRFNGNPIPGGSGSSFSISNAISIPNVQPANAGGYSVLVNNQYGSDLSRTATLTVLLPQLTFQPLGLAQARIAWRTNLGAYLLESASNLAGSPWNPVTNIPSIVGNSFSLTQDFSFSQKFFRLRKP